MSTSGYQCNYFSRFVARYTGDAAFALKKEMHAPLGKAKVIRGKTLSKAVLVGGYVFF